MLMRREFYLAAGKCICGLDVIPIVEIWVAAGDIAVLNACFATVRPLGFAIISTDKGYWLANTQDLSDLAHAVAGFTAEARAS
jgi:hypothetical protein